MLVPSAVCTEKYSSSCIVVHTVIGITRILSIMYRTTSTHIHSNVARLPSLPIEKTTHIAQNSGRLVFRQSTSIYYRHTQLRYMCCISYCSSNNIHTHIPIPSFIHPSTVSFEQSPSFASPPWPIDINMLHANVAVAVAVATVVVPVEVSR